MNKAKILNALAKFLLIGGAISAATDVFTKDRQAKDIEALKKAVFGDENK